MFKHILFPTDGSANADIAAHAAMRFAKSVGARVTAVHVLPVDCHPSEPPPELAGKYLLAVQHAAAEQGISCEVQLAKGEDVAQAILQTAFERQCDLLALSSRGLGSTAQAPPGSATLRMLTLSQIPVLLFR